MQRTVPTPNGPFTYELVRTRRASVEIRILPENVRLFAPPVYPLREADRFVMAGMDRIRKAQAEFAAYRRREENLYPMTDGMVFPLEGVLTVLNLARKPRWGFGYDDYGGVVLSGPDLAPDAVRTHLREFLIDLARRRVESRVGFYAPRIGRTPGRITVREQKTKWGSCSSQGNLNFNWKLIMAPEEALDYVVIHELCHLYEFNHSDRFWERVARYQPEYAQWRDFLRSGWSHPYQ